MARMRKKKNLPARLAACSSYWFKVPVANRGQWREACNMPKDCFLSLELGCGKGEFAVKQALAHPDRCYIALERDESVILMAMEKAAKQGLRNLFFLQADATQLRNYFLDDELDRIYINFCDPWSRRNKPKRRLTYREYLKMYQELLKPQGEIHFKTDDDTLFEFSLEEFAQAGFSVQNTTWDLHNSQWDKNNIRTEFEQRFASLGIPIKRLEAFFPQTKA